MQVQEINFPTDDGQMRGWFAMPKSSQTEKVPCVVVIHELTGLVDNIRPVVARFAESGYAALAPDLFDKPVFRPLCMAQTMLAMQTGIGPAVDDLDSALRWLRSQPGVDADRMAAAGFCMGGGFALLMALRPDMKAAAPYYGTSEAFIRNAQKSCPVVAGYGEQDLVFRGQAARVKNALDEYNITNDVKSYPNAGHSYMTEEQPGLLYQFGKIGPLKVGYRPDEAEDSWQRMLDFFNQHV